MKTASSSAIAAASLSDGGAEVAVLGHLLDRHPRALSLLELAAELRGVAQDRALRRALANLTAASLVCVEDGRFAAAPVAVNIDRAPQPA